MASQKLGRTPFLGVPVEWVVGWVENASNRPVKGMATAGSRKIMVQAGVAELNSRDWDWARQAPGLLKDSSSEDLHFTKQPETNVAVCHLHLPDSGRSNQEENCQQFEESLMASVIVGQNDAGSKPWWCTKYCVSYRPGRIFFPSKASLVSFQKRSFQPAPGFVRFILPQKINKWHHAPKMQTQENKTYFFSWLLSLEGTNLWSESLWVWADMPPQPSTQTQSPDLEATVSLLGKSVGCAHLSSLPQLQSVSYRQPPSFLLTS